MLRQSWTVLNNNQIKQIENFFSDNKAKELILNKTTDEVFEFYFYVLQYYSSKFQKRLLNEGKDNLIIKESDLFDQDEPIRIYNVSNKKKFEDVLQIENKKIIFTEYKIYKLFKNKTPSINAYSFENDIKYFIKNELNINNADLTNFCINNPFFIFSETSKYFINQNISLDKNIVDTTNHILEIRKSIYNLKNNKFDVKAFYRKIKHEAKYKRFNFLIY